MVFAVDRDMNESDSTAARTAALRLLTHGRRSLPDVEVDSYSVELESDEGLTGDQAAKGVFIRILDELRQPLRKAGTDPLGTKPSARISRKKLDEMLANGEPEETALVQGAVEEFAQQLAAVVAHFLKLKSWRDTESIVVGADSVKGVLAKWRSRVPTCF